MFVTLLGIVTLLRFVQSENAQFPMPVTLFPIVIFSRLIQYSNAPIPMFVTLSGIIYSISDFPVGNFTNIVLSLLKSTPFTEL